MLKSVKRDSTHNSPFLFFIFVEEARKRLKKFDPFMSAKMFNFFQSLEFNLHLEGGIVRTSLSLSLSPEQPKNTLSDVNKVVGIVPKQTGLSLIITLEPASPGLNPGDGECYSRVYKGDKCHRTPGLSFILFGFSYFAYVE